MNPALALPAAKLALGAAGSLVNGVAKALSPEQAKAKKQADDFETVFLEQVTQQLLTTPEGSEGPLGQNGIGGDVFKSQLSQQYAKNIQQAGGVGLSAQIMRDLIGVQAQASTQTNGTSANVVR